MKKNNVIITGLLAGTMLSSLLLSMGLRNNYLSIHADPVQPFALTLDKNSLGNDKNGNPLPDNGNQSYDVQEFELDEYITIRTSYGTKNNDMLIRLNNRTADNKAVSYIEKVEPCYGMTSIYIDLIYGFVEILTGYEPGVWSNRYIVKASNGTASDKLQKTIDVEGNYFRVENTNKSTNALIKSITVNYGCSLGSQAATPAAASYEMERGTSQDAVRGTAGHWFYHWNGNWRVSEDPKPQVTGNGFTGRITVVDSSNTQGIWFRYQPTDVSGCTNRYNVTLEVKLSVAGKVAAVDGDKARVIEADTWSTFIFSERTYDGSTQPFYLKVSEISEVPEDPGYITIEVRNILVGRVIS